MMNFDGLVSRIVRTLVDLATVRHMMIVDAARDSASSGCGVELPT
jgi:hypothetical protein